MGSSWDKGKEDTGKQKVLNVLRWIVALPASVLGCVIAYGIFIFWHRIVLGYAFDPHSLDLRQVFIKWIGAAIMGATFVYISVYIVPSYKKQTGIVMAGIVLLLSGAFLFAAIITRNYWVMFEIVGMNVNVGSITVAYGVFKHETQKENDESAQQWEE